MLRARYWPTAYSNIRRIAQIAKQCGTRRELRERINAKYFAHELCIDSYTRGGRRSQRMHECLVY